MSLIINKRTEALWLKSQAREEWATTRFWEYVLKDQFFVGSDWAVSSQQPPTDQRQNHRRMDLLVERRENGQWSKFMVFEAKKHSCSTSEMTELEQQVYTAGCAHIVNTKAEYVYGMTVAGTKARLWHINGTDYYAMPFVPDTPGLGEKSEYIEAHSTNAAYLREGLNLIIRSHAAPPGTLKAVIAINRRLGL